MRRERAEADGEQTEVTLKSLHVPHNGLARRTEFSERVGGADMNAVLATSSGIGERIRELIGERPLAPLFKANTRRERQELLEADSNLPLAEVDLDDTSIETPSGASQQLQRVEVECLNATPEALQPFVEQLRDAAQLEPVAQSKFRAGLEAAGLNPEGSLELPDTPISATQPFADTQFTMLRRYFAAMLDHEPLVRAGSTTAVHEMRVAARHLDVLLRLFPVTAHAGPPPRAARCARSSSRSVPCVTGMCSSPICMSRSRPWAMRIAQRSNLCVRESPSQRAHARARLLRWLDSNRMRAWVGHWLEQLRLGTASSARARQAITAKVARDLIRSTARKLRKRADALNETSSADAFHEVRIRAKRLRYALDAFGSLYGDAAREYLDALARLQNVLGEFHDSAVRTEMFGDIVTHGRRVPAATSFLVGRLVERDQRKFEKCRRRFAKAYRRIRRGRWRALSEAMRELESTTSPAPVGVSAS